MKKQRYFNRELSWLSFNYRVLQEAKDESLPLLERIKFLAIYSSNLDEFFRVRVASLRSLLNLKPKSSDELSFDPKKLLKKIKSIVNNQQEEFGKIYNDLIIPALKNDNIYLLNETQYDDTQKTYISNYFDENISSLIQPILLDKNNISTFLQNKSIYLAVRLERKRLYYGSHKEISRRFKYAIVEIPSEKLKRFIILPENETDIFITTLDDVLRFNLAKLFPGYFIESCYSIKLTRDAELYIDDEFTGDLLQKIKKGLSKRKTGVPSRFLYDQQMPKDFLKVLVNTLKLTKEDLVAGGKYHNLNDLFNFPNFGLKHLSHDKLRPLPVAAFESGISFFESISKKDELISFPYQSYDYVINYLREAAIDEKVVSIKITLYRVSNNSQIVEQLILAAKNSKKVVVFIEVKARFDEELNFASAEQLEKAGVKIYYSFPKLKVHSKLCLIERVENDKCVFYSYIATGNFNENTSKVYCDYALFTKNQAIGLDIKNVFKILSRKSETEIFEHLLVAPFNLRKHLNQLIDNEITFAKSGKKGEITLKLNSLEDWKLIDKLYEASVAGVKINIIVRGICCLIPGLSDLSKNIKVISIVDRYLEHSRVYIFHNNGNKKYFISSADFMRRNLNRRTEVALPIFDNKIKNDLQLFIDMQLNDNVKARIINKTQNNLFVKKSKSSSEPLRSQHKIYEYLKQSN